eukprot:6582371-Lingulodinium_polyedra.AAC.1
MGPKRSPSPGSKDREAGSRIDIMKIWCGYSPGREIWAAKQRLQEVDGFEQEDLQALVNCAVATALARMRQRSFVSGSLQCVWIHWMLNRVPACAIFVEHSFVRLSQ